MLLVQHMLVLLLLVQFMLLLVLLLPPGVQTVLQYATAGACTAVAQQLLSHSPVLCIQLRLDVVCVLPLLCLLFPDVLFIRVLSLAALCHRNEGADALDADAVSHPFGLAAHLQQQVSSSLSTTAGNGSSK